jgi:hypothetical protein
VRRRPSRAGDVRVVVATVAFNAMAAKKSIGASSVHVWSTANMNRAIRYGAGVACKVRLGIDHAIAKEAAVDAWLAVRSEISPLDETAWKPAIARKVEDKLRADRRKAARRDGLTSQVETAASAWLDAGRVRRAHAEVGGGRRAIEW